MKNLSQPPPRATAPSKYRASILACLVGAGTIFSASAGQFRVAWDAHPELGVTEFRVYRIDGPARVLLSTSLASPATIEANPGDTIAVTAFIAGGIRILVIPTLDAILKALNE